MRGKGLGLICHFLKALHDRGVSILTDQDVASLAVENGRVTGVVMRSGEVVAAKKGVILATGGYGANPQMSWDFEQLPGFAQEASGLTPASLTGDGIVLGAEIGSATGTQVRHHMFAIVDRSALTIRPQNTLTPTQQQQVQWQTVGQGNQTPQWQTSAPNPILTTGLNTVLMPNAQQNPMVDTVGLPNANPQVPPPLWAIRPGTILTVDVPGPNQETVVVTAIDQQNNPPQWFQAKFNKVHGYPPLTAPPPIPIWVPDLGNPGPQPGFRPQDDSAVVPYYTIED